MNLNENLKYTFKSIEESLKSNLLIPREEFNQRMENFKNLDFRNMSDDEIFWISTYVVLYSGIKAVTIEQRLDKFKNDLYGIGKVASLEEGEQEDIISRLGFPKKIGFIHKNALTFQKIQVKYGSFGGLLHELGIKDVNPSEAKIEKLRSMLMGGEYNLHNIGPKTSYHFLTDLGFDVIKPDRVVCRIFERLGLIKDKDDIQGTQLVGKKMSRETGYPIRYIDIVLVKYGQVGESEMIGTKDGICLEDDPKCRLCKLSADCSYFAQASGN